MEQNIETKKKNTNHKKHMECYHKDEKYVELEMDINDQYQKQQQPNDSIDKFDQQNQSNNKCWNEFEYHHHIEQYKWTNWKKPRSKQLDMG